VCVCDHCVFNCYLYDNRVVLQAVRNAVCVIIVCLTVIYMIIMLYNRLLGMLCVCDHCVFNCYLYDNHVV